MSNINYELAKQLKDAGFPQVKEPTYGQGYWYSENGGEGVYIPTLSELIEACQKGEEANSVNLFTTRDIGCEAIKQFRFSGSYMKGIGSTPEEAVAKLWLQLHPINPGVINVFMDKK